MYDRVMATRQFQLTHTQVDEFRRYEQQCQGLADLRRLQAVRLYGTGYSIQTIQDMLACPEGSLRAWVTVYTRHGIQGLFVNYERRSQNARKLGVEQEEELGDKLH